MSVPVRLTDLRARAEQASEHGCSEHGCVRPAKLVIAPDVLLALVDAVEAADRELAAVEAWATEQPARSLFADQVRYWAISQRDKLRARFDYSGADGQPTTTKGAET